MSLLTAAILLGGCAGLPRHVHKTPSSAFQHPETTTLGQIVAGDEIGKNLSGIRLLSSGEEALASLITLADHAERTLDIQYYIIHEDDSTQTLLHHVRLAADRGVRVRVLVDDLNTAGEDRRFMHLSSHANVEVRVFNPFTAGRFSTWTRLIASATDIRRINHRMHNKLFVADDALAITGGRNIGDQYFTLDPRSNFVDLDVVAAGPIVPQLSASFDQFWNSKYAIPIASVASSVDAEAKSAPPVEAQLSDNDRWLEHEITAKKLDLIWAPATVLADRPAKIASETSPDEELTIANDITALMGTAKQDLSIISPYFIPGKQGVALIAKLVEQGVHVRILTNSLASTDSPLVDIGYARYRVPLLKLGVDLREMRP
ncbi:MAG TPA: phospholipase D-like domain-containing protein, partial [Steroidobacteraceae bacterium]|nr:phospholipase D-like domain-containing protein [Steroidobacteraceae bacterium]